LEEAEHAMVSETVGPGVSCGGSKAKPAKAKRYMVMIIVAIT